MLSRRSILSLQRVNPRRATGPSLVRSYRDDGSFGFRKPKPYKLPDCECSSDGADTLDTQEELDNRNANAPLLRFVESVRRHGHRAAQVSISDMQCSRLLTLQIDPLELMERE